MGARQTGAGPSPHERPFGVDSKQEAARQTTVLLADDHDPLLNSLSRLLEPQFDIVGAVCEPQKLLGEARRLKPDVVVVDLAMPEINGIEATRLLKSELELAVVILTSYRDETLIGQSLAAGALGYVVKSRAVDDLARAVENAARGLR